MIVVIVYSTSIFFLSSDSNFELMQRSFIHIQRFIKFLLSLFIVSNSIFRAFACSSNWFVRVRRCLNRDVIVAFFSIESFESDSRARFFFVFFVVSTSCLSTTTTMLKIITKLNFHFLFFAMMSSINEFHSICDNFFIVFRFWITLLCLILTIAKMIIMFHFKFLSSFCVIIFSNWFSRFKILKSLRKRSSKLFFQTCFLSTR